MIFRPVFTVLPFLAQAVLALTCNRHYTIKAGDTCDSISAANNVSTYQLAAINRQIDSACSNLQPQADLCLGYLGQDCSKTYKVILNDICNVIAANHNINTTILYANNPQIDSDCSNIYVDEVLCVLDKVEVPPVPSGYLLATTIPATATPAHATRTAYTTSFVTITSSHASTPTPTLNSDQHLPYCDEL